MLKALLFDLDGTLANTDPIHYETWRQILIPYGLQIDPAFYQARFSGRVNQEIVRDLLPQLSDAEGEALSREKEAQFRERAAAVLKPTPGFMNLLNWADKKGLLRTVVTNAPAENVRFMLEVLQLESIFPNVVLGDELPLGKPDPLPYRVALEELGVLPSEAVAFEDSPSGIRSAVGAGIVTVALAIANKDETIHDPQLLHQLGATLVVSDFADARLEALLRSEMQEK